LQDLRNVVLRMTQQEKKKIEDLLEVFHILATIGRH
jgi:hypothetical protein